MSVVLFFAGWQARATTFFAGNMTLVNNTSSNLVSGVSICQASLPRLTLNWQHTGLAAVSDVLGEVRMGIDNTNFLTLYTFNAAATNGSAVETVSFPITNLNLYVQIKVTTTNSQSMQMSGSY